MEREKPVSRGGFSQSDKTSKEEDTDDSELTSGDTNNWFSNFGSDQKSDENKTRKDSVITFKRTSASSRNSNDDDRKISLHRTVEEHSNKQRVKLSKNERFKKNLKNLLFGADGGGRLRGRDGISTSRLDSKRFQVDGQTSSGTVSTYLSYSYSSDSSQRITQSSETNSNFYEEQQGLLSQNQSYSSSIEPSPTISNCDETHNLNTFVNSDNKSLSLVYKMEPVRRDSTLRANSGKEKFFFINQSSSFKIKLF